MKKILILANNNTFTTWQDKLASAQAFYASVIDLQFTIINTDFQNVPLTEIPVLSGPTNQIIEAYTVDTSWYERNIGILAGGVFNSTVFALNTIDTVPQTPLIPAGVCSGSFNGVGEITLFIQPDSENWLAMQNGIQVGNAIAFILEHEISHWLSQTLGMPVDLTHQYFYSTNPQGIILEIQNFMEKENKQTESSLAIYNEAQKCLGTTLVPVGDNSDLGCAISVSTLYGRVFPNHASQVNTVSTATLLNCFTDLTDLFEEVDTPLPGDFIISATGTSSIPNTPITNGHCGVIGDSGIMSNNSLTGLWSENYTLESWNQRYAIQGGYPVRFFRTK